MSDPTADDLSPAVRELVLAFADDEHLIGQRHTEWIGVAPFLEEDLAFASIGQDELGHAAGLYAVLVGDDDAAIDRLAFGRPAEEYRSCWLVEYETADWAETAVRHWFYDAAERLRWELLTDSSVPAVAELVERALREEAYHRRHVDGLLDVLLEVDESRRRVEYAATQVYPLAVAQFDAPVGEDELIADGVVAGSWGDCLEPWEAQVVERFPSIDWASVDRGDVAAAQASRTRRHEHFELVHDRIREVLSFDPDAVW